MKPLAYERRILVRALLAGLIGSAVAVILLWTGSYDPQTAWTLTILIVIAWLGFAFSAQNRVTFPLRTLSNMLAALREGDFSIRARSARNDDALGEVMREVNALGDTLHRQRLGALEATALLRKVMEEIDIAVFAFDSTDRLRLLNRSGERILNRPTERALGKTAAELGIEFCLTVETPHVAQIAFPGKMGRWEIHRGSFREGGKPHQLVLISDLSQALREEERLAWQRLIRVIGHELNNSLAPIKSVAESLSGMMARSQKPPDWEDDMSRGLAVIANRTDGLARFMNAYARLARLPAPQFRPVSVSAWIQRAAGLDLRMQIPVHAGPELTIQADSDQLDQVLINLIKNAVDAATETGGGVQVGWETGDSFLEVWVRDEGPGIPSAANLFVPFFTTKPGGSGIGLVLSRQIAEAHGGTLSLDNVTSGRGCEARLRLPLVKI
ncbi:MAG TPA: ATP-binding protein [Candidatus Limnocylindrales bacterium]|nr:ATP-binding protein [Candidatus Limnocylindrales bacterium]